MSRKPWEKGDPHIHEVVRPTPFEDERERRKRPARGTVVYDHTNDRPYEPPPEPVRIVVVGVRRPAPPRTNGAR